MTGMEKIENGTRVWFYAPGHNGEMTEGIVVNSFERHNKSLYNIEVETHVEPIYFCRDWFTISLDGKRLNLYDMCIPSTNI